jgi:hypothetical protein
MSTIHRSRTIVSAVAAMFMVGLLAPSAVHAEDPLLPVEEQALAPAAMPGPSVTTQVPGDVRWAPAASLAPTSSVDASRVSAAQQALLSPDLGSMQEEALRAVVATAMSWDQTSGYGVVEAIRAEPDAYAASIAGTSADAASGVASGAANRVANAQHALDAGDLGSMQEDALTALVAAGESWDEISGYGVLEASRAVIGHPAVNTTAESSRVAAAQQALLSGDLGSMQEEALAAVVAASTTPDEASVDDALAANRTALLAQFRAVELSSSSSLGADQHLSSCAAAS